MVPQKCIERQCPRHVIHKGVDVCVLYQVSEKTADYIYEDYGDAAKAVNDSGADWALKPISVCLAASVSISEDLTVN